MPKYTITVDDMKALCEIEEALQIRRRNLAGALEPLTGLNLVVGGNLKAKIKRIDAILVSVDNADEVG